MIFFLLQLVSLTVDGDPLQPMGCVGRYTSHVIFLMHFAHNHTVHITLHGSRRTTQCVCARASFHLHVIHDVCLIVRWLFPRSVLLLLLSVVCLFSSLSYLYSAQHFISNVNSVEGNNRCAFAQRGVLPPWRKTILPQNEQAGRGPDMAQKVFWICEAENGT